MKSLFLEVSFRMKKKGNEVGRCGWKDERGHSKKSEILQIVSLKSLFLYFVAQQKFSCVSLTLFADATVLLLG